MGKKKSIFNDDNTHECETCRYYRPSATDEREILCSQKGVLIKRDACQKYEYDPMKRVPRRQTIDTDFKKEDFEL